MATLKQKQCQKYRYTGQCMPIIHGQVIQTVTEYYKWGDGQQNEALILLENAKHDFKIGDEIYIEIIEKTNYITCIIDVRFLTAGYALI